MMEFQSAIKFDSPGYHLLWASRTISLATGAHRRSIVVSFLLQRRQIMKARFIFLVNCALSLIKCVHLLEAAQSDRTGPHRLILEPSIDIICDLRPRSLASLFIPVLSGIAGHASCGTPGPLSLILWLTHILIIVTIRIKFAYSSR